MTHTILSMWRSRSYGRIRHEVVEHRSEPGEVLNELKWAVGRWI